MNRRKELWNFHMFANNVGKSQNYFDELFQNLKREQEKMEKLPEDRQKNRSKKIIENLLEGYGIGLMLK